MGYQVNQAIRIAVIGLGPRGLSMLERLCANASVILPAGYELLLHLIDPHAGNGGRVWRDNQNPVLLINAVA
jgi:hypothetical protein